MTWKGQDESATRGRKAIAVTCLLIALVPLAAAAPPQVEPESAWRLALERIGAKDYQGAAPLLDDLHKSDAFPKANEAGFLLGVSL
ncbi:MAG: hypothetical protein HY278_08375 [candidate division NC10 bacterium]|nr:hypothetical protein [candidate division NC10 bacterium]